MNGGFSQSARILDAAQRDLRLHKMARVPRPVNVTDAREFPNIAAAIKHAAEQRLKREGEE